MSYLPFRLTNNIVDFMGKVGLYGLFAGVITSCSLALSKHHEKIMPLLQIVFRDEVNDDKQNTILYINHCSEYMKHKMLSLANNKNVLSFSPEDQSSS